MPSYTQQQEQYIIDNHGKMSIRDLGAALGRKESAIRKKMVDMRKQGIYLVNMKEITAKKVGEISVRKHGIYIKTETGFVRCAKALAGKEKPKPKLLTNKRQPAEPKPPKKTGRSKHAPKPIVKVLARRKEDLSKKQAIYIPELRMTVYADKGKCAEVVRRKYLEHREHCLKTIEK